jgi:hypothetical protein
MGDPTAPSEGNSFALYSVFCGVIAVPAAFILIGALFGVFAIVLGRLGLQRAHAVGEGARLAIAGIVLGVIAIVITIAVIAG